MASVSDFQLSFFIGKKKTQKQTVCISVQFSLPYEWMWRAQAHVYLFIYCFSILPPFVRHVLMLDIFIDLNGQRIQQKTREKCVQSSTPAPLCSVYYVACMCSMCLCIDNDYYMEWT